MFTAAKCPTKPDRFSESTSEKRLVSSFLKFFFLVALNSGSLMLNAARPMTWMIREYEWLWMRRGECVLSAEKSDGLCLSLETHKIVFQNGMAGREETEIIWPLLQKQENPLFKNSLNKQSVMLMYLHWLIALIGLIRDTITSWRFWMKYNLTMKIYRLYFL